MCSSRGGKALSLTNAFAADLIPDAHFAPFVHLDNVNAPRATFITITELGHTYMFSLSSVSVSCKIFASQKLMVRAAFRISIRLACQAEQNSQHPNPM